MDSDSFAKKVLIAVGITLACVLVLIFIGTIFNVLLIVIAAVLVAVFFDGMARAIHHRTSISISWSRVVAVFGFLIVAGVISFALAPYVGSQAKQLRTQLPSSVKEVKQKVQQLPMGEEVLKYAEQQDFKNKLGQNTKKFFSAVFGVFGTLADIYIILFMGFLILASPQIYVDGIIHLVPKEKRKRAREVMQTLGQTLRSWLTGKLLSMLIVAVFTWIGLWIIGIPLALILGITAGILAFVPNFGPLIALVLGVMIAATQGTDKMLWTAAVYIIAQVVESNFLTPMIQRHQVSLPMAMILLAQLVLGVYTGALGLILATPLFAIVMVLIKMLYVEDILGDHESLLAPEKKVKQKQSSH